MLTGPNWQLAITSLQFRTGFCACWYPAWSHTLDKSHTAESTDVAENFQGSLLKNSQKLKKCFPSPYTFCLWCWSLRSLETVFLLIMLFRWLWWLINFWNLKWKNICIYVFLKVFHVDFHLSLPSKKCTSLVIFGTQSTAKCLTSHYQLQNDRERVCNWLFMYKEISTEAPIGWQLKHGFQHSSVSYLKDFKWK